MNRPRFHLINPFSWLTGKIRFPLGFYRFGGCSCRTCKHGPGWGFSFLFFGFSVAERDHDVERIPYVVCECGAMVQLNGMRDEMGRFMGASEKVQSLEDAGWVRRDRIQWHCPTCSRVRTSDEEEVDKKFLQLEADLEELGKYLDEEPYTEERGNQFDERLRSIKTRYKAIRAEYKRLDN